MFGDDIGLWNLSCYSDGLMGYRTPNIDRIAEEGVKFTDCYAEHSCAAGRASFISGQSVFRTARSLDPQDATIAELLRPLGYSTAQFGPSHFGARDEDLPTSHGFDEFYGSVDPRGVIHSWAGERGEQQRVEEIGALRESDDEFVIAAHSWITRQHETDRPWFCWVNTSSSHDAMIEHDAHVGQLLALLDRLAVVR